MENDLIFRHAAIEAIQNAYCDTEGGEDKYAVWKNVGLTEALHIMQDLPAEKRWIPVTEMLPAAFHQVLCYGYNGIMIDYFSGETTEIYGKPLFMISGAKITHWMPLPEPPKEEKNG